MAYRGLQNQIWHNNLWSLILLISFPLVFAILTYLFFLLQSGDALNMLLAGESFSESVKNFDFESTKNGFFQYFPFVGIGVFIWFMIAFFYHSSMIEKAVGAKGISRKENLKIYNLLENLCISQGMKMPKLAIIEDSSLNAFASGINENTYTITLSRGIIEKLDEKELEAVLAHELGHIKNKDTRLLIISIIFIGLFSFLAEILFRSLRGSGNKKGGQLIIIGIILAIFGYIFTILIRFALSRKREYLADAASVEMTKNPLSLASALRKISGDPIIEALKRKDLAQAFIENPEVKSKFFSFGGVFSTHPPIKNRIKILENF